MGRAYVPRPATLYPHLPSAPHPDLPQPASTRPDPDPDPARARFGLELLPALPRLGLEGLVGADPQSGARWLTPTEAVLVQVRGRAGGGGGRGFLKAGRGQRDGRAPQLAVQPAAAHCGA